MTRHIALCFAGLACGLALTACTPSIRPGPDPLGTLCATDAECQSTYCADSFRCAPRDQTGQPGEYCHHDNHCRSQRCSCDNFQRAADSFCNNFRGGNQGTCLARRDNGDDCTRNENCTSGYCADAGKVTNLDFWPATSGGRCAPVDSTGAVGAYCHHDNHCSSGNCNCPGGKSFGFCAAWEGVSRNVGDTINGQPNLASLDVQMRRGFFVCN